MSDSYRPHGLQPTRLLCPWNFPGKSTGVGCHCLLWPDPCSLFIKDAFQNAVFCGISLFALNVIVSISQSALSLSHVWLFVTPQTEAGQASLSITNSRSLLKLISINLVMPSNHLILCRPFLLLLNTIDSLISYLLIACESVDHTVLNSWNPWERSFLSVFCFPR